MVGLPGEEPADAQALVDFLESLSLGPGQIALNRLYVACGTELYRRRGQFNIQVENLSDKSVETLYRTRLPEHVDDLPAISNSISYIQRRYEVALLSRRLQSRSLLSDDRRSLPDFALVESLGSFKNVVCRVGMSTTIYVLGRTREAVEHEVDSIARYLVAERIPISIIRRVVVIDDWNLGSMRARRPTLSQVDGPIRVFQLRREMFNKVSTSSLDCFADLDLLLLISERSGGFDPEFVGDLLERTRAVVAFSVLPLLACDLVSLSDLSQWKFTSLPRVSRQHPISSTGVQTATSLVR